MYGSATRHRDPPTSRRTGAARSMRPQRRPVITVASMRCIPGRAVHCRGPPAACAKMSPAHDMADLDAMARTSSDLLAMNAQNAGSRRMALAEEARRTA